MTTAADWQRMAESALREALEHVRDALKMAERGDFEEALSYVRSVDSATSRAGQSLRWAASADEEGAV